MQPQKEKYEVKKRIVLDNCDILKYLCKLIQHIEMSENILILGKMMPKYGQ